MNGCWHSGGRFFCEYSPGSVTSILMWMNLYFIARYSPEGAITSGTRRRPPPIGLPFTPFLFFLYPISQRTKAKEKFMKYFLAVDRRNHAIGPAEEKG